MASPSNGCVDKWVEVSQECKVLLLLPSSSFSFSPPQYLPEQELKQLCDLVCDLLLEESNVQPVGLLSPATCYLPLVTFHLTRCPPL